MPIEETLIRELESFGRVLSTEMTDDSPVFAFRRNKEVELLQKQLDRARQKSLLLVGPSGCGKSAILQQLIHRISVRRNKPWLVLETSTSLIMKGTRYLGEWQTRFHELIDATSRAPRIAIYFTDVANLTGAGRHSESEENLASALVPHMESGNLVLVGELTEEQLTGWLDRHPWFRKLFSLFRINPLSDDEAAEVIQAVADQRSRQLRGDAEIDLHWSLNALAAAAHFGRLYFPGTATPGGAIRLIDHLVAAERGVPRSAHNQILERAVEYQDVVKTLATLSGIPSKLLDDSCALNLQEVRDFFQTRVIGQEPAVKAVVDLITLIKAGLTDPRKPMGVFLFVGPTGVGKTEMAKSLADFIFGSADRLVRYDMSEFKDYHSFEKLIGGSRPEETSVNRTGSLLHRIRQQPFSVILLDEIEKAHENVFDLLLQLFDDGRLSDSQGHVTDFTQTIVIMTSNLGTGNVDAAPLGFGATEDHGGEEVVLEAVKAFFRPELVNRIDRVIAFRPLEREHVRTIAKRELGHVLMRQGIRRRQMRIDVDRGVVDILAEKGFHPSYGARPLKRAVEQIVLLPIARQLAQMSQSDRPALLRLVPVEGGVALKVIHDRQSRTSESIARGVTLTDPHYGTRTRLTPRQLQEQSDELRGLIDALESTCEQRGLSRQKSELVARTAAVDFWDQPRAARELLDDLYRLDRILDAVQHVRRRSDDVAGLLQVALKEHSDRKLKEAAERIAATRRHAEVVRFSLLCQQRRDRCDAFVVVAAVDPDQDDNAGRLADMYSGWARSKGFQVVIAHEELYDRKVTQELVLLIEGVGVYGLLRREQGLHEFVSGKTSDTGRTTAFVKVQVMPLVEDADPDHDHATISAKKTRGEAIRSGRFRAEITATDKSSGVQISIRNALDLEEAKSIAHDLLRAERHRQQDRAHGNAPDDAESVIRRYTLRPSQSAKDLRSGVIQHNLRNLWKGALDEFLLAVLEHPAGD